MFAGGNPGSDLEATLADCPCCLCDCRVQQPANPFQVRIDIGRNIELQALPCGALREWQPRIPGSGSSFRLSAIGLPPIGLRTPLSHLFVPAPPHLGTNRLPYISPFLPDDLSRVIVDLPEIRPDFTDAIILSRPIFLGLIPARPGEGAWSLRERA